MALMTPAQARAIDPLLTQHARGYVPQNAVGQLLFPTVGLEARGAKVIEFSLENMGLPSSSTARSPGDPVHTESYGYTTDTVSLEDHAIDVLVPIELNQEANAVPKISLVNEHLDIALSRMSNQREKFRADLATDASGYAATNKTTLASGSTAWTASGSDPIEDVEVGKHAIMDGNGGLPPNVMVLSPNAFRALKSNDVILEQIKYTGAAPTRMNVTTGMLADLFDIDQVVVGNHRYDNAGTFVHTWGNDVVMAYSDSSSMSRRRPSYGYNYLLSGYPNVEQGRYDGDIRSWKYGYNESQKEYITMADSGYLITDAGVA